MRCGVNVGGGVAGTESLDKKNSVSGVYQQKVCNRRREMWAKSRAKGGL